MSVAADAVCDRLRAGGGRVEMHGEMVRATFDVIGSVTLTGSGNLDDRFIHRAIDGFLSSGARVSILDIFGVSNAVPRPSRLFRPRTLRRVHQIADEAIAERRARGPMPVPDFLDALLDAADPETGRRMNPAELRDNLLAFIVAGHETTALALAWSFYLIAFDPAVQRRLRREARGVIGKRTAGAADVPLLPYARQVIEETLRLYPPAAILSRTATAPDTLCGREIRRGDTVILPVYALHRHHSLWDRPDEFDPDRFAGNADRDRFAYLPFGDGPRICIGASFAMIEAVIILATLAARFRFTMVPGRNPKPVMVLTLRPEGGVHLRVEAV